MKIPILGLFLLTGCGSGDRNTYEYEDYVENFEKDFNRFNVFPIHIDNLSMETGHLAVNILAICHPGPIPKITVSEDYWPTLKPIQREIVLYHELGHCILNRPHIDSTGKGRLIQSLMNSKPLKAYDYVEKRDAYLRELFTQSAD